MAQSFAGSQSFASSRSDVVLRRTYVRSWGRLQPLPDLALRANIPTKSNSNLKNDSRISQNVSAPNGNSIATEHLPSFDGGTSDSWLDFTRSEDRRAGRQRKDTDSSARHGRGCAESMRPFHSHGHPLLAQADEANTGGSGTVTRARLLGFDTVETTFQAVQAKVPSALRHFARTPTRLQSACCVRLVQVVQPREQPDTR